MASAPYEWLIGTRYLRSTHRRGFVSFVALMSVLGLMLGVATLLVVLSVMNGFERELRTRILSVTSHATLTGFDETLTDWQAVQRRALTQPGVQAAVPYVEAQALLAHGGKTVGASIRGVLPDEERKATGFAGHLESGRLEDLVPGQYRMILGSALARALDAHACDSVVVITPSGTATPSGIFPRTRRFKVSGVFESGMYEYDRGLALVNMIDARVLYKMGEKVSGIRLAVQDPFQAPATVRRLALALGGNFLVTDWTMIHVNFFKSIQTTKTMMFVILLMIVAVAAFNIVATLVMIVKEKQSDIAILRTLGAGPRNVLTAFAIQGVVIGLAGTLAGAVLGTVLSHHLQQIIDGVQHLFGVQFMDASVYFMNELPAYVEPGDVVQICSVAFLLCVLATVYPAWRASRTAPADALRHE
jgi:lipoprotein-releasing system permease protein